MPGTFDHGHALIAGIGDCAYPPWSLPVTKKDAAAIRKALTDPGLCAYPDDEDHIRLLHDGQATRDRILEGLAWLAKLTAADREATAIVYFSGHGWLEEGSGEYFLIPHDVLPFDVQGSAIKGKDFQDGLRAVAARRLLVLLDCCRAEGMATSKEAPKLALPRGITKSAVPPRMVEALKTGEGRAVFSSSRGTQLSWIRPDEALSIYTHHLLEALEGAANRSGETTVNVSNLMNHLAKAVPESASKFWEAEQVPFFDMAAEDFPVALLRGGKGLPKGGWKPSGTAAEKPGDSFFATNTGSGAIAQGPNAVAAGEGGIAIGRIGGDVTIPERVQERGRKIPEEREESE